MGEWWARIRLMEPARVRAVWTALVGLLAALGVTVAADVDGAVQAVIVAVCAVLPLVQGESTRAVVSPAAATPGADDGPPPGHPDSVAADLTGWAAAGDDAGEQWSTDDVGGE